YLPELWTNDKTRPLAFIVIGSLLAGLVAVGLTTQRHWISKQSWWPKLWAALPCKEILARLSESYDLYGKQPRTLLFALILSVAIHSGGVLAAWSIGAALDLLGVNLGQYLLYCPLINAFAALPFTVGGLGLREGAYQFFFALQGV